MQAWEACGGTFASEERDAAEVVRSWDCGRLSLASNATHYGFVRKGAATIEIKGGLYHLRDGMHFSVVGTGSVQGDSDGFVASRIGYGASSKWEVLWNQRAGCGTSTAAAIRS